MSQKINEKDYNIKNQKKLILKEVNMSSLLSKNVFFHKNKTNAALQNGQIHFNIKLKNKNNPKKTENSEFWNNISHFNFSPKKDKKITFKYLITK